MKKIGILSDTHGTLMREAIDILKTCDLIIHAGDFSSKAIARRIEAIAPTYLVRGNNDFWIPYGELQELTFVIERVQFFLIHNRYDIRHIPEDTDIVIYGHTHLYSALEEEGRLWLNPGSAWHGRYGDAPSMVVMEVDKGSYSYKRILLD